METAREHIRRTLQLIGVVGQGEDVSAAEANDALAALNDMLGTWSIMGAVFAETREEFALTPGTASYTIGTGGDFDTERPIRIVKAFIDRGNISYPLQVLDQVAYADLSFKDQTGLPCDLYYDAGFPLGNIVLNPVPNSSDTLNIYSEKPLTGPATLDTVLSFPPGYSRGFRFNLAVDVAPEYGIPVSAEVQRGAASSLRAIKKSVRMNDDNRLRASNTLIRMGNRTSNYWGD